MIPPEWFGEAERRIGEHVLRTPLTYDPSRRLFMKWENQQVTGSFKARGALNKVLGLEPWERERGVVAASAGNHGQGVALAAGIAGCGAEVFASSHAVQAKIDAMRKLGAMVHTVDGGYGEAEAAAISYAGQQGKTFVSPYNDGLILAGQGTVALEVARQLKEDFGVLPGELGAWIIPVSGGGLACGCAAALESMGARPRVFGVQAAASAFTESLFHRGTQDGVMDGPTLADGLSGPIDERSITIPMLRKYISEIYSVSEAEIEAAMAQARWDYGETIEGSAAAALAAVSALGALDEKRAERFAAGPYVVVLTGGNVDPHTFAAILERHPKQ